MAFPTHKPSGRSFAAGNYPYKTFSSQSGKEYRILYGDKRTGMKLSLQYANISDAAADDFVDHYDETKGGFDVFSLPSEFRAGWSGDAAAIDASTGNSWRYESPPQIASVRPGTSSVTVNLIGVL
tara:strand:+ start:8594 stop:8968 length:375 start_codon:yes stop_codon:yes gene_type:complete